MAFKTLDQADAAGKRVLVRTDFNVPMEDGRITDDTRLKAAIPTIQDLRKAGAKVVLISHFDRPKGQRVPSMSLKAVAEPLSQLIGAPGLRGRTGVGGRGGSISAPCRHQKFLPSITVTGQSAASTLSSNRALTAIRRVRPSQLPSRWKSGLSA